VVALAVVWLLLRRPLSCGDIVLVIVVALLVAWMLELLQHRPEETTEGTAAAPIDEHGREPVPGAETTQASLDAVVDREPAPVQQIVSQLIGLSEVTRSTGRDIVVVPRRGHPIGAVLPGGRVTIWCRCRRHARFWNPKASADGLGRLAH
jgi:hypothetical protein